MTLCVLLVIVTLTIQSRSLYLITDIDLTVLVYHGTQLKSRRWSGAVLGVFGYLFSHLLPHVFVR